MLLWEKKSCYVVRIMYSEKIKIGFPFLFPEKKGGIQNTPYQL
ncbi:hypothetical protein MC28_G320 (plasmid) [Bacillus thuringiensis MC28]|nr:hypothetical protein MC28_G320 [Bacillus thuringiensis MC28]